ncbi:MAG: carboxylate-amine ligase, partial [Actinobacteria bacterium]
MARPLTDIERGTVVVLPSATFPESELRKIVAIQHYEERLLCTTLLLANPDLELVYITSLPVDEAIVEYYLRFVPDPGDARRRLHPLVVGEDSGRALTAKVLDAPHVIDGVRALVDGAEHAYIQPFNVTELEGRFAELVDLPLFGASPQLARLGSKTESRRAARKAGVAVLDGEDDLRSVAELEAAIEGLRVRRPEAEAAVVKLNDGFSGQGHAIVELAGFSALEHASITFIADEESWPSYAAKVQSGGAVVEELVRAPGLVSPSVQLRITPGGAVEVVSNHDQILGGLHDQVYLGCRFPARAGYRLDIQER